MIAWTSPSFERQVDAAQDLAVVDRDVQVLDFKHQ